MEKIKIIIHEEFTGRHKPEDVFAVVFLSNAAALTEQAKSSITEYTDQSQDSLCSEKGATYGTSEE